MFRGLLFSLALSLAGLHVEHVVPDIVCIEQFYRICMLGEVPLL